MRYLIFSRQSSSEKILIINRSHGIISITQISHEIFYDKIQQSTLYRRIVEFSYTKPKSSSLSFEYIFYNILYYMCKYGAGYVGRSSTIIIWISSLLNCWRYLHTRHAAKPKFFQWKSTDSQSKHGTWSHRQKANIVRQLNVAAWNDRTTNWFPQQKIVYKRIHADTGRLARTF